MRADLSCATSAWPSTRVWCAKRPPPDSSARLSETFEMKTGIALLNFGGPWTLSDVKPFLYRLFANPSVLVGVPAPLRQLAAFAIAQVKGPSSVESYRLIGGGSPQLAWTEEQAQGPRRLLGDGGNGKGRPQDEV